VIPLPVWTPRPCLPLRNGNLALSVTRKSSARHHRGVLSPPKKVLREPQGQEYPYLSRQRAFGFATVGATSGVLCAKQQIGSLPRGRAKLGAGIETGDWRAEVLADYVFDNSW